jgi:hypothetical protein
VLKRYSIKIDKIKSAFGSVKKIGVDKIFEFAAIEHE